MDLRYIYNLPINSKGMKEEDQKTPNSNYQKQMLINRLYKSKNNPANNKQLPKPEQETNLLFYVILQRYSKPKRNPSKKKNQRRNCPSLPIKGLQFKKNLSLISALVLPAGQVVVHPFQTKKSKKEVRACQCEEHR